MENIDSILNSPHKTTQFELERFFSRVTAKVGVKEFTARNVAKSVAKIDACVANSTASIVNTSSGRNNPHVTWGSRALSLVL